MRNWFTLAGVDSRDFGVYISGQGTFGAPAKAYELLSIPGRNGAIIGPEKRLENATVTYSCYIYSDFEKNIADFRTFLLSLDGYQVLTDSYHTDEFRLAVYQGPFDPEVTRKNDAGSFELVFSCKPQRYLFVGDTSYIFDLLNTSLYGAEIYVPEPAYVGTSRLTCDVFPADYPDFDDPGFSVGGTPNAPIHSVPTGVRAAMLYIDGNIEYNKWSAGQPGMASGQIDYIAGTATINSTIIKATGSSPGNWAYDGAHVFSATADRNDCDKIKYCTHFMPVDSMGELTGNRGKIILDSGKIYVYDPRYSTLSAFTSWLSSVGTAFSIVASLTNPITFSITPYVPDYPEDPFTIRAGVWTGMSQFIRLPYAATDNMENPTRFPAKPLIRVYGTGTVTINDIVITVSDVTSYVDIDCELMDCYEGSTNRNDDVAFSTYDFPVLMPGVNPVSFVGPSSVEITPRWWRV